MAWQAAGDLQSLKIYLMVTLMPKEKYFCGLFFNNRYKNSNFIFAIVLFFTSLSEYVPFSPGMPGAGLDLSWVFALNQALAQGFVFGKDVVFTFGPYASIYTQNYHPATNCLMIVGAVYLGVCFFISVYGNFINTKWRFWIALLLSLCAAVYSRDALFLFYPLTVGVFVYKQLRFSEGRRVGIPVILVWTVLFCSFGLLPLVKGSFLLTCFSITALSAALLIRKARWRLAGLVSAAPVVSMSLFWVFANQPIAWLPNYVLGLFSIIGGYTEAMAANGGGGEIAIYAIAGLVLLWSVLIDVRDSTFEKFIVGLMFLCTILVGLKSGFVRHDGHAIISGTIIVMLSALSGVLASSRGALISCLVSTLAYIYISSAYLDSSIFGVVDDVKKMYTNSWVGIKKIIYHPDDFFSGFSDQLIKLKALGAVQEFNGTVDIYSFDQSYLIASGNKWSPRPVFQSYAAYTSKLAELNRGHLLGPRRPDNIIFKVQPIDGRLPSLEDGASWPVFLSDYEPTSFLEGSLYLKHRQAGNEYSARYKKIFRGGYALGEEIELPKHNGLIFSKIKIKSSLIGGVVSALFKPSQLEISVVMNSGAVRRYRIISGMAESGFVISPLVENTDDFSLLFAGVEYLADKSVRSIEINSKDYSFVWNKNFDVEFFSFEYEASSSALGVNGISRPSAGGFSKIVNAGRCDGSVDYINGVSPAPVSFNTLSLLKVNGWLSASVDRADVPDNVYVVLTSSGGERFYVNAKRTERPDVGVAFKNNQLNYSGFSTTADVSSLNGAYVVGLAYSKGNILFMCPQFNFQAKIGRLL